MYLYAIIFISIVICQYINNQHNIIIITICQHKKVNCTYNTYRSRLNTSHCHFQIFLDETCQKPQPINIKTHIKRDGKGTYMVVTTSNTYIITRGLLLRVHYGKVKGELPNNPKKSSKKNS